MDSGRSIVIEQRPSWEACTVRGRVVDVNEMVRTNGVVSEAGKDVEVATVLVTPPNTNAWNPAFDVTPASLIAGIVTELGVAKKGENGQYNLRDFVAKGRSA
jgi:methylthioribose-1-phosphate isomerase